MLVFKIIANLLTKNIGIFAGKIITTQQKIAVSKSYTFHQIKIRRNKTPEEVRGVVLFIFFYLYLDLGDRFDFCFRHHNLKHPLLVSRLRRVFFHTYGQPYHSFK